MLRYNEIESAKKIIEIISEKTDYHPNDDYFYRSDNRDDVFITGVPRKRQPKVDEYHVMNWVDSSEKWKNFPKRIKSLTFSNIKYGADFGENIFMIIPFKNTKIALSNNGDFNYGFKNKYLDDIKGFGGLEYYINFGRGAYSIYILDLLLSMDMYSDNKNTNKLIKIRNSQFETYKLNYYPNIEFPKNLCKTIEDIINKNHKIFLNQKLINYYFDNLNKEWNNYYEFVDKIMSPEINGFEIIKYKDALNLNSVDDDTKEYWIDDDFIMINSTNIELRKYVDDTLLKTKYKNDK